MKTTLTATLAVLLLAGASGAAMAQDRDRGDRGQSAPQPHAQPQHAGPPPGAPGGHVGGPPHVEGGPRGPVPAPRADHAGPPGGFHAHEGVNRGPQGAAGVPPRVQGGPGPVPGAPRQFEHDRDRDHGRGPVVPPGGFPGGLPGVQAGRGPVPGAHGDRHPPFGGTHGAPPHWQAGRFPPVIWAHDRFRTRAYRPPYGYYSRAWVFGDFLPRPWFVRDYWLDDFLDFDLPYPPPGFVWVRVGPDALLVDRFTGRVVQVVRDIFW